jgi:signal transduction histidine kinase
MLFVLMRVAAYGGALLWIAVGDPHRPSWHWAAALLVAGWGVWDRWKRPDEPERPMRLGVWTETAAVIALALVLHVNGLLLLLVSPLVRAAVHLPGRDVLAQGACSLAVMLMLRQLDPGPAWLLPAQLVAVLAMGPYAYVLGSLVRERDRTRRLVTLAAFEREQRSRDEERVRIAGELHDVMGQYWTGVIRALDVALLTTGDQQRQFLTRARQAALDGLQEMRMSVRTWNEGRQTPAEWIDQLQAAAGRFRELVGIAVSLHMDPVDWQSYSDPNAVAEAVARTAIESLTNAVRHGSAATVGIVVEAGPAGLLLTVLDDGTGLKAAGTRSGTGMRSMEALAARAGGGWAVAPGPDRGVIVTLRVPTGTKGRVAG